MFGGLKKTTSALAILAAAGFVIGGVAISPTTALAADLGGDCCADLEERVAELEATTARKGNKKVSLTITGRVTATMTYWTESAPAPKPTTSFAVVFDDTPLRSQQRSLFRRCVGLAVRRSS